MNHRFYNLMIKGIGMSHAKEVKRIARACKNILKQQNRMQRAIQV
jgi:hypothetical protein